MSLVSRPIFAATLFAALCAVLGQAQSSSADAVGSYYFDDDVSSEDGSATPSVAGSRQVDVVEAECECEACSSYLELLFGTFGERLALTAFLCCCRI